MGIYELRACSCLLLREQWLCPHGYIQGQTQLRLFIWENLSNLDTSFYAPELRQVALDLKGVKTSICLLRLERAGRGNCKTLLQMWLGYLLTSWVFFLSSFFSPPSPSHSLSLSFPPFLLLLLPLCSIRMHLCDFPVCGYIDSRGQYGPPPYIWDRFSQWTEVQWFSWASCQQVSKIPLSSAPLNSECAPTRQVLRVLGFKLGSLCLHDNQFTNGVITQPSPAFLKSETVGGWGGQSIMGKPGGHLHVDVAVVPHCQPDSVNIFLSQNEISVDNLFGKNVIGKVTNNGWLRDSDKCRCQFRAVFPGICWRQSLKTGKL